MFSIADLIDEIKIPFDLTNQACEQIRIPFFRIEDPISPKKFKLFLVTILGILENTIDDNTNQRSRLIVSLKIEKNRFTKHKTLKLDGLHLSEIPQKIFDLTHLQILDLSGNDIKTIPDAISHLSNLRVFIAHSNLISDIPNAFSNLKNLKKIILHCNEISSISNYSLPISLEWLGLSNNKLGSVPNVIFNLPNLKGLWLCENQIDDLPKEMHNYIQETPSFRSIYLRRNPLKKIPLYKWEGNRFTNVKNYLSAAYKGTITNYEAKIILVGNGNEGKTTLRKRLCDANFTPTQMQRTDKIEIENMNFEVIEKGTEKVNITDFGSDKIPSDKSLSNSGINFDAVFKAKIWDFGGQEIQRNIHSFFLTDNALYLLLWSVRQSEDKYANLKYWLNAIKSHSPKSKIVIVLNKAFDIEGELIKQENEFLNEEVIKKVYPNVIDFVEISALYGKGVEGENGLRDKIKKYLPLLDKVGEELPISWFKMKEKLESLSTKFPYIDLEDFWHNCLSDPDLDIKENNSEDFVNWLVNIGAALYYPNNYRLERYLFLDPEWIIKPVYQVLLDNKNITRKNGGRFTYKNFGQLCELDKANDRDIIIALLSEFNLSVSINESRSEFIVPQLLNEISEIELLKFNMAKIYDIHYEYRYLYQPKGMLNQIIAECKKRNLVKEDYLWNNAVILTDGDTEAIIYSQIFSRDQIIIRIKGPDSNGLLKTIRDMFRYKEENAILESERVACNCPVCRNQSGSPALFDRHTLEDMVKRGKSSVQCTKSYEMIDIIMLSGINYHNSGSHSNPSLPHNKSHTVIVQIGDVNGQILNSNISARDINMTHHD